MHRTCPRPVMTACAALSVAFWLLPGSLVRAQPAPSGQPSADPALDAARAAFGSLPEADRRAVQDDLIWTGLYSGMADGTFGRQTYDAIAAWQTSTGRPPSGILDPAARSALRAASQRARDVAGFEVLNDSKTGVRIGVPLKLLSVRNENPNGGSRWQSPDGRITLDTRTAPPDATLQALYDRNLAVRSPGRVVAYKVLRPDFFVIAGETATGKFYTRYAAGPAGIRAFSIGYDKALAPQVDRVVVAVANAFTPFPAAAPSPPSAAAPPPAVQPDVQSAGPALIGTGLAVGARQVLTAAPVDRCTEVRVRDLRPQRIDGKGPFLLQFAQDLGLPAARFGATPMEPGAGVLVVAYSDDGDGVRLTATAGDAEDAGTVVAPLQPGASGAPVLDREKGLVGLAAAVASDGRRIAGLLPSARHAVVPAAELSARFPGVSVDDADRKTPTGSAALVAALRPSVVPIVCGP